MEPDELPRPDTRAALQRATEELARQRAEIERLRRGTGDPIAIVGMACRLPGAPTTAEYWRLLARGGDAVTEVPRERWDAGAFYDSDPSAAGKMTTRQGAFISGVDQFDPLFFGIAPREAQSMDPQQRLLLEVTWEALEQANIAPPDLYGSATGVFVGITCFDHAIRISRDVGNFNSYAGTGSALNMAPGRVSYVLGLTGPSMAVDTACSSSLVCLHLACQSLRDRDCDAAIVGGVHLMLSPEVMVSFSQARMLAPDGRSKTFDASADGYSRGEGCGVAVLKRYADAVAAGDTILGVIRGTAVNQDGPSGGLTVPNGAAQQQVMRRALAAAGVEPAAVDYVEAHGTGTSLGDPIEVEALAKVYGEGRSKARPLLIGSAKTNIGHLEPAAGIAGLIKILLSFQHGAIPQHLHCRTPNPHISWDDVPVKVATEAAAWPRTARPRIAGLSAFGFSGTNAHAIVAEPPVRAEAQFSPARAPCLLPLSARSAAALQDVARRYASLLADDGANLAAIAYTAGAGRAHFSHRLAVLASTVAEARDGLAAFVADETSTVVRSGRAANPDYRRDAQDVKARLAAAYGQLATGPADRGAALDVVATLYLEGVAIDWRRLGGDHAPARVTLPTYPFERQRYWIETRDRVRPSAVAPWIYQLIWTSLGPAATHTAACRGRRWAIVPGGALAARVQQVLVAQGAVATIVPAFAAADAGATDIIFLNGASDAETAGDACVDLLGLIHGVAAARGPAPRIWAITQGAIPVGAEMTLGGAAQAPLAALARALGLERPELFGRLIDLDPADSADADALVAEILEDDVEDQIALRSGERLAERIDRVAIDTNREVPVRADATYLITGGTGRIGLHVAGDLARRGARYLCLVGRRGLTSPERRAAVAELEAQGVHVRVATADVADRDAIAAVLRDLSSDPPLRGAVHAAGVPGYADLAQLTAADVAAVLAPKIRGAWNLHDLTRDRPLDFFVCFSSIASAWGSRGQAHYAAGNAFLDALAHLRRAAGLPAVTINWGPWADGGMTSPQAETLLRRVGIRLLPTGAALAAFGALASADQPQVVVADIDWPLFKGSYEARGHRRLLERIGVAVGAGQAVAGAGRLARPVTVATIQREVAEVLGLPAPSHADPAQGLFEMGMDSLMALELRTRLETLVSRALPATLVFDYPTIEAIGRFLAPEPWGVPAASAAAPRASVPMAPIRDLDTLSEEEAEAMLLKKLETIL